MRVKVWIKPDFPEPLKEKVSIVAGFGDEKVFLRLLCHAQFNQNFFHQAPARNRGLEKIGTHECGEPEPVDIDPVGQGQTDQNKAPCNKSNPSFNAHKNTPLSFFRNL
jgi:hypothetical protein